MDHPQSILLDSSSTSTSVTGTNTTVNNNNNGGSGVVIPASVPLAGAEAASTTTADTSSSSSVVAVETSTTDSLFKRLQQIEINCYGSLVSAFRAQGELTWQKHRLLDDLRVLLHVSPQRHRAELLRAECDPILQKIAVHCSEKVFLRPKFEEEPVTSAVQTILADQLQQQQQQTEQPGQQQGGGTVSFTYSDTESDEDHDISRRYKQPKKRGFRRQYVTPAVSGLINAQGVLSAATIAGGALPGGTAGGGLKKRGRKKKDEFGTSAATPTGILPGGGEYGGGAATATAGAAAASPAAHGHGVGVGGQQQQVQPAAKKSKRSHGGSSRPPKPVVDTVTAAAVDSILQESDNRDINALDDEEIFDVSEKEQTQIDQLEKLLMQTEDSTQKKRIGDEVQRKKDKLLRIIEYLEAVAPEDEMEIGESM